MARPDQQAGSFAPTSGQSYNPAGAAHYGTAGPEFVRQLIAHNISEKDVRERVDTFVRGALQNIKDYHGQAARVAERFGLISAAGEYGVQFGILPWEQSDAFNDAMELFKAWLERRGGGTLMRLDKLLRRSVISSKRTAIAVLRNWFRSKMKTERLSLTYAIQTRARRSTAPAIVGARARRSGGSYSRKCGPKKFARGSIPLRWPRPSPAGGCLNLTVRAIHQNR
jgi:hypothetical protein